jgi:nitroreductase
MEFIELARNARSTRRFIESEGLCREDLHGIIQAVSLAPCAGNLQRLRYSLVTGDAQRARIFSGLKWAALLEEWTGPEDGQRPAAYIVISSPEDGKSHLNGYDSGIAAAYITLAAREKGLGSCILLSFSHDEVASAACTEGYSPELVIALGYPGEEIVLERCSGSRKYYRDSAGRHHVPKLSAAELIAKET